MSTISALIEKKGTLIAQMRELTDKADAEKRNLTPDESIQFDKIEKDYDDLLASIERKERIKKIEDSQKQEDQGRGIPGAPKEMTEERAWHEYLQRGDGMSAEAKSVLQKRGTATQVIGDASLGGNVAPTIFSNRVIEVMKAFGGMLGLVDIEETNSGQPLTMPKEDNTAQTGGWIAETDTDVVQDTTWSLVTVGAHMLTSKVVKLSWEFLQDNVIGAENRLINLLGKRMQRTLSTALVTGSGSGQPEGFITGGGSAAVTTASATVFVYDEIIDLIHSLDPAYRQNASFVFNDTVLKAIRKLKSTTGEPLWQPSMREGVPDRIHGIPYTIVTEMANYGTSTNKFMAIGDFKAGMFVRKAKNDMLVALKELYALQRSAGYFMVSRWDAKVIDASAFKIMAHA